MFNFKVLIMRKNQSNLTTLLEIYDDDLERLGYRVGIDRSANTLSALRQGRGYVAAFIKERLRRRDVPLQKLTPQWIREFSVYLSVDRRLLGGTVWLACQQLKGVVARAHQRGLLTWNPFAGFHIAKKIRPRQYLSEEELKMLAYHDFRKKSLNYARDIFIFASMTGLSFVDISELRSSDVVVLGERTWIVSKRHKTEVPYQVRLLDTPLRILRRYQQTGRDKVFDHVEYRTMANRIRIIMNEIGIKKRITMHCARHTFAVLAINKGMPIESLSRILGHTNITTTQIYAKITMQKLDDDITEFEKRLCLS